MKRIFLIIIVIFFSLSFYNCTNFLNSDDDMKADNTSEIPMETMESFSFDFSSAESFVTTGLSNLERSRFDNRGINSRELNADSPLLQVTKTGELKEVFSVPEGVELPKIRFVLVAPNEQAIYVCFDGSAVVEDRSFHFMKLYEDGSFQVLEEKPHVIEYDNYRRRLQKPAVFDKDGNIFYVIQNDGTQKLVKFENEQRRILSPNFDVEIKRFFTDGTNLFYFGRNNGSANNAIYLKVVRPGPQIEDVFYRSDGEAWIKDAFIKSDGSVVLSGWQIPDPEIENREYTGILELKEQADGTFSWKQVYGSADTDDSNANRLVLNKTQFEGNTGELDKTLIDAVAGQFFTEGVVPPDFDHAALLETIVDIDASVFNYQNEITFWRELLGDTTVLDEKTFEILDSVESMYIPPFLGYKSDTGADGSINEFIFDILFSNKTESKIPVHETVTTVEELNQLLNQNSDISDYFSTISVKSGLELPSQMPYITSSDQDPNTGEPLPTDYAEFKDFLDSNFTYQLKDGIDLSNTNDFNLGSSTSDYNDIFGVWQVFIASDGPYPGSDENGSRVNKIYPYRSFFINDDGSVNTTAINEQVQKYYPNATVNTVGEGADIKTNSSTNKANFISEAFNLGDPRYNYDQLTTATLFDTYVKDPYQSDNTLTLFDSFSDLELFTISENGSYYGVFEMGGGDNFYKTVRLMNNNGIVDEEIIRTDINSISFIADKNTLAWVKPTSDSTNEILTTDITENNGSEPTILIAKSEGLEIFDFAVDHTLNTMTFSAWSQAEQRSYVGRVDLLSYDVNLLEAEGLNSGSRVTVY